MSHHNNKKRPFYWRVCSCFILTFLHINSAGFLLNASVLIVVRDKSPGAIGWWGYL